MMNGTKNERNPDILRTLHHIFCIIKILIIFPNVRNYENYSKKKLKIKDTK